MLFPAVLSSIALLVTVAMFRISMLFQARRSPTRKPGTPTRLMIVLGSGGHTAEMLAILRNLDTHKYTYRSYVISSGDNFSADKAREFEAELANRHDRRTKNPSTEYDIAIVPRARKIHQSILTTPVSSVYCLWACLHILCSSDGTYPDLIITNGPATGVIIVLASLLVRFCGLPGTRYGMRTVYVESWARVRRLSLSGRLLLHVVDRFIVQWEKLAKSLGGQAEYIGVLV